MRNTETDESEHVRRTGTTDNRAVSPVIGVILMVAITVILAAVIGTFVLGLGDQVQETPSAGVTLDKDTGQVDITLTDPGNVDSLQLIAPEGAKSTVLSAGLGAGAQIKLRSNGTLTTFFDENNLTVPAQGGATEEISGPNDVPASLRNLQIDEIELEGYTESNAYVACVLRHSGFEVGGQRIPSNVSIPCHSPVLAQLDSVTPGTSEERTVGGNEVTATRPVLLKSGDYQLLGLVGGDSGVIQTISIAEETAQEAE